MKTVQLLLLATITFVNVNAQKLPNVQQKSMHAPVNVKIDGKTADWGDKFEAKNATTDLMYTIANDDKKLYLVAQTDVVDVYNRISNGGIKLVIQKNGRKSEEGAALIKFPFLEKPGDLLFNSGAFMVTVDNGVITVGQPKAKELSSQQADSVMLANNKKLTANLKWIYTRNIANVDSLIPVYNDKGLYAAAAFDNKKIFTLEMAIDLNLLGLNTATADKFSYHLVVNSEPNKYKNPTPLPSVRTEPSQGAVATSDAAQLTDRLRTANQTIQSSFLSRYETTDFWGEYTLAK